MEITQKNLKKNYFEPVSERGGNVKWNSILYSG